MACEGCKLKVFGVYVDRAHFAFFVCALMTIGNIFLLYPALLEQKVSYEQCNELIANFSNTHDCYATNRTAFNWSVYNGGIAE